MHRASQILAAKSGTMVKAGDLLVRFDPSTLSERFRKATELKQADAEIEQAQAQTRIAQSRTRPPS
jgi:multidrug resistance efflux pump